MQTLAKPTKTSYREPRLRCQDGSTVSGSGLYLRLAQYEQKQGPRGARQGLGHTSPMSSLPQCAKAAAPEEKKPFGARSFC